MNLFDYESVMGWRRSWNLRPPEMQMSDAVRWMKAQWTQPLTFVREKGKKTWVTTEKGAKIPLTESLEDCFHRVLPIWNHGITPRLKRGETVLIVAHANTIRALIFHIDQPVMTLEKFKHVHIPSSIPLLYNFDLNSNNEIVTLGKPNSLGMRGKYIITKELLEMNLNYLDTNHDMLEAHMESEILFSDLIQKNLEQVIDYADNGFGKRDALIITDGQGVIVHTNEAWSDLCGFTKDDVIGMFAIAIVVKR